MCKTNKTIPDDSLENVKNNLKEESELTRNETNLSQHHEGQKDKAIVLKAMKLLLKAIIDLVGNIRKTTSQKQHQQEW